MNEFQQKIKDKIVELTETGMTDKADYHSYEEIYPILLEKFLGKSHNMLEIGIGGGGGGLKMLCDIFPESNIYGIDNQVSRCQLNFKDYENLKVFQFDQCDSTMLERLPMLDFVTEDASHIFELSIRTFEMLESKLNTGAVYVIEDVYPQYYDLYLKDGRFEMHDLRNLKDRGDNIMSVYYKE